MRSAAASVAAFACLLLTVASSPAAPTADAAARVKLHTVAGGLERPLALASPRGARRDFYVAERPGRIIRFHRGRRQRRPFLDITALVKEDGEGGLLSFAFAPGYRRSGWFFVSYWDRAGNQQLAAWRRSPRGHYADPDSGRVLLTLPHPNVHHFGGDLQFGPDDGHLYYGIGDGGDEFDNPAPQDLDRLYGKIVRIDPTPGRAQPYRIPSDNPWAGSAGRRGEIWTAGVRNPWRFSFDARRGHLLVADVGNEHREEINWLSGRAPGRAVNLGWACWEGSVRDHHAPADCQVPGARFPEYEYEHFPAGSPPATVPGRRYPPPRRPLRAAHMTHGCTGSITGGHVVRDRQLGRGLQGRYVFADYCSGGVFAARRRRSKTVVRGLYQDRRYQLASFGRDACGRIYALHIGEGKVKRLQRGRRSSCAAARGR